MKSLQLWLAVLGGLLLAAVIAHGTWQQRKGRRARESDGTTSNFAPLDMPVATAVADTEPLAARLDEMPDLTELPPARATAAPAAAMAKVAAPAPAALVDPTQPMPLTEPMSLDTEVSALTPEETLVPRWQAYAPPIDSHIDVIARLPLDAPVSGEALLAHFPTTRRAGGKPFAIEGRNQATGRWEAPATHTWYTELQAGVQMANRMGPLNEIEYSEFVQKVQTFADSVGAGAEFPDMLEAVARARELDGFAGAHDAQLAMRLHASRGPWPLGWVLQHTSRHGFIPGPTPGRLVLPSSDEGAPSVLSLQFDPQAALADDPRMARITELSLLFDVPQTPERDNPFNAWCASGQALSIALDAQVYDDQGQPLSSKSYPVIAQELEGLYRSLEQHELAAGSPTARRLFS